MELSPLVRDARDRQVDALSQLLEVALRLATEHDLDRILEIVTNGVCKAAGCERASLFLIDDLQTELYTRVSTELEINEIRHSLSQGVTGWVARHREVARVPHPQRDQRWDSTVDRRTGYVTRNILAVPVISNRDERLVGVLQLLNKGSAHKGETGFGDFEEQLARAFAAHAATALERRRLEQDARYAQELQHAMEMGRRIQREFLPDHMPTVPGYDVASWWQPAEFVSGDYYDWLTLANGHTGFVIGDVSGHGLGASLIMASVRAMLHVLVKTVTDPDLILELLSSTIEPDLKQSQFITFVLAVLDPVRHEWRYANAGHAPALHFTAATRSFRPLETTCLPLGFPRVPCEVENTTYQVAPGDIVVLGTDGIIEVRNDADEMFGTTRLQQEIARHAERSCCEIVAAVRDTVQSFHGKALPPDDSTLVIIKRVE